MSEFKSPYRTAPTPTSIKGSLISTSPEQSSHITRHLVPCFHLTTRFLMYDASLPDPKLTETNNISKMHLRYNVEYWKGGHGVKFLKITCLLYDHLPPLVVKKVSGVEVGITLKVDGGT